MLYKEIKMENLNEIKIRKITENEMEYALDLVMRTFLKYEAPDYTEEGIEEFKKSIYNKEWRNKIEFFGAFEFEKMIGVIATRDKNHIALFFVEGEYHRKGIGKKLYEFVCEYNDSGYFTVNSSPYAHEIYKHLGFVDNGEKQSVNGLIFYPMKNKNLAKDELELVFPTETHKKQVEEYLQEFFDYGEKDLNGDAGLDNIKDFDKWLEKIRQDLTKEEFDKNSVSTTEYLSIRKSDGKIVGNLQIRHKLNEKLLRYGGHIGDSVRPSERRKGYATKQIALALEKCKELGIDRVLMDCNKENIGSRKSIVNNGGILDSEILINGELMQNFWISLKKKFVTNPNNMKIVEKGSFEVKNICDENFCGDVAVIKFEKMLEPYIVKDINLCMADDNYKWLEFYDYNSKARLTAMYNEKDEIIEWYFDIARTIGKENGIPYEDDLYLDVVVMPNGDIILLDEDELKSALERLEITKEEYNEAYKVAYEIMEKVKGNVKELKKFTDKYL